MEKRALMILASKGLGAAGLFSAGAGGYVLFAPKKVNEKINSWNFEDKERIIKDIESINATSKVTRVHEYHDSKFFYRCNRGNVTGGEENTEARAVETCSRYIESKAHRGHPIWVFLNQDSNNWSNSITDKWDTYKFTFSKNVEENIKDYYGKCFPDKVESEANPCAQKNLPEGWTKSLIPKKHLGS